MIDRNMKRLTACLFSCLFLVTGIYAHGEAAPDFMQRIGKIYVVAGVCLIILIALLAYIVVLDRKIFRIENRQKNE